jgi:hypothetical protein
LQKWIKQYEVEIVVIKALSPKTCKLYLNALQRFIKLFDAIKSLIANALDFCGVYENSSTYNNYATPLNTFFAFCLKKTVDGRGYKTNFKMDDFKGGNEQFANAISNTTASPEQVRQILT